MNKNNITGRMDSGLGHYWYPLGFSQVLRKNSAKPQRFVLLDTPIVLWRSQNEWRAHKDICPHRQAPLSSGLVVNDELVCPYHGWSFKPCGTLSAVPSLCDADQPKSKPGLIPFLVHDDNFMVWVCLQKTARLAPPKIIETTSNKSKTVLIEKKFNHHIEDIIENFMDSPHTLFVHSGLIRDSSQLMSRLVDVSMHENEVLVSHHPSKEDISLFSRLINPQGKMVSHTDTFILPAHVKINYYFETESPAFSAWVAMRPISENQTQLFFAITLNFNGMINKIFTPVVRLMAERVLWQDRKILDLQRENLTYEKTRYSASSIGDCASNYVRRQRYDADQLSRNGIILPARTINLNL